jgi:hypothetical protein
MTQSERQEWERERTKGYDHFLLSRGLLREGLSVGACTALVDVLFDLFCHRPIESIWKLAIEFGAFALVFGWIEGARNWRKNGEDFEKPSESECSA